MTNDQQVRQIPVREPVVCAQRYEYADAFEAHVPDGEACPPEQWVAAGLDSTPRWVGWIVRVLGVEPSDTAGEGVGGWDIVESTPDIVHLEQELPLLHAVFVGRNVDATHRMLTTALTYDRPLIGRLVWSIVGIAHRRTARRVIIAAPSTARADERR